MLGCKVFLTYKRKRLTGNGLAHGNGCQSSVSVPKEMPPRSSDLYDNLIDKHPSEDETGNPLHICRERSLCCSCIHKQDSMAAPSMQKSSRLDAENDIDESSKSMSKRGITGQSCTDNCLQYKSCHPRTRAPSSVNADILGDNDRVEERLVSHSMGTATSTMADYVGLKPSVKIKSGFESRDTVSMSKTSSMEISDSLVKDKTTVSCCNFAETTKFRAPLITFIRRCKRKGNTEGPDTKRKLVLDDLEFSMATKRRKFACDNTVSHAAAREKGCSVGDATDLKLPEEVNDSKTTCAHARPVLDTEVLIFEGEEPADCQNVSKDVLHEDEKGIDQSDELAIDVQQDLSTGDLGISLNNAVKDSSSNDEGVIAVEQPIKEHACEREESRAILNDGLKATVEGLHLLDLSVTPTDSSGTVECNAYLESNSQKQSVHAVTETLLGSLDSTSRSHAAISHQTSPPELLNVRNERLGESTSTHHLHSFRDANAFVEEPSANCKDGYKPSSHPLDFMSKNKCLQLFAEERPEDSFQSAIMQPEVTTCLVSEERKKFHFENENHPKKRRSPPFLGLALPTKPKTARFASNNCFTTFPFSESRQLFEDTLPQSSSSKFSPLLRHKSMLDGIVNRARALSERDIFQDKLKTYTSAWTEEELDSLWIGVRRYGRDNWNTMITDPRLRFSSWRVARDLAERWEEEQSKLFQGTILPQFQQSKAQGISLGFNNFSTITGIWRETTAEETQLSLGDVYNRREHNISRRAKFKSGYMRSNGTEYLQGPGKNPTRDPYLDYQGESFKEETFNCFRSKIVPKNNPSSAIGSTAFMAAKGNLPHWLREAVFSSPSSQREPPLAPAVTSIAHSHMMHTTWPYFDHYELPLGRRNEMHHMGGGPRGYDLQTSGGGHRVIHPSGTNHVADIIVIDSDASSEETVSDDHCARP